MVESALPYLCVRNAAGAVDFYRDAFGAELVGEPAIFEGKIGHAALRIGQCSIFLADEFPEYGVQSPLALGGCTATVVLTVDDVDGFVAKARSAGATIAREPADEPYGRTARVLDPFGQRWIINAAKDANKTFLGLDHVDTRVDSISAVEAFYDDLMPKLGLPRKRFAYVDAAGDWQTVADGETYNAVEYYEDESAVKPRRFIGFIEDRGMTPQKTRIAFRVSTPDRLKQLAHFLAGIGAKNVDLSADMQNYPAVFFEDPAGTRLELCARPSA